MDKFKVMRYLFADFTKYGLVYPKRAREIARGAGIALTETHLTLYELLEKGLIWKIGKKYKYRFGLKEGSHLEELEQIYNCLNSWHPLPLDLRLDIKKVENIRAKHEQRAKILQREVEEQREIKEKLKKVKFLPMDEREEALTESISRVTKYCLSRDEKTRDEDIRKFLEKEFKSVLSNLYGAEIVGGN